MHGSFDMKIVITKKVYSHMMLFPIIAMMSLLLSVYSSVSHETQKVKILPSPNSYKMVYNTVHRGNRGNTFQGWVFSKYF